MGRVFLKSHVAGKQTKKKKFKSMNYIRSKVK